MTKGKKLKSERKGKRMKRKSIGVAKELGFSPDTFFTKKRSKNSKKRNDPVNLGGKK